MVRLASQLNRTDETRRKTADHPLAEGVTLSGVLEGIETVRGCDSGEARFRGPKVQGRKLLISQAKGQRVTYDEAVCAAWSSVLFVLGSRMFSRSDFCFGIKRREKYVSICRSRTLPRSCKY